MAATVPILSSAPRRAGSGTSIRWEFRTMNDLKKCLEDGTFVFTVDEKPTTNGMLNLNVFGSFSDGPSGHVYFALAANEVEERDAAGKTEYYYKLSDEKEPSEVEDSVQQAESSGIYGAILDQLSPHLSAIRIRHFPDLSENMHKPRHLKLKMNKPYVPKATTEAAASASSEAPTPAILKAKPKWAELPTPDMVTLLQMEGRLMVKLSSPWICDIRGEIGKLMGVQTFLARFKYLTDTEKVAKEKASKRTLKKTEEGEVKKIRKEG